MRHHPHNIAAWARDPGDVVHGTVRIGSLGNVSRWRRITKDDAVMTIEFLQRLPIAEIVALHVTDWNAENFALAARVRERGIGILHAHMNWFADVFQTHVAHQRSWQQPGLAQNLESITDSQHQPTAGGETVHRLHYRGELGDGASPQIVAVGKTSGDNNDVTIFQIV